MKIPRWASTTGRAAALFAFAFPLVHCFGMTAAVTGSDGSGAPDGAPSEGSSGTSPGLDAGNVGALVAPDAGGAEDSDSIGDSGGTGDAELSADDLVKTCATQDNVRVGSYVVETDYWNQMACPGMQCVDINEVTGAFTVTQGPSCGNTVTSFPNVLYGNSFGEVSSGSALPKQVSALTSVTSDWSFTPGGASTDRFDVAYDIWFCPDDTCGPSGFNGGAELMIWLNYPNTSNPTTGGSATLDGYNWEISTFAAGGTGNSWTYIAYMIQPTMVTSVTDFNLLSFFQDAESKGYIESSWYLYAIQAGIEIRTGGTPFTNNGFSVTVQ
jgi:hypothetical protein